MTTLEQIQDLAAALHARRPTWDLLPTANYLLQHKHLAYDELAMLATAWAENPSNRTPASLRYMTGQPVEQAERTSATQTNHQPEHLRARHQAIAACEWCDDRGRLPNGYLCPHDDMDERAERAKHRAAQARAQIRRTIATPRQPKETK